MINQAEIGAIAASALTRIEKLELRRLQWGFVSGTLDEVESLAEIRTVCHSDEQAKVILDSLIRSHALFEIQQRGGIRVRSRFAETVRLLTELRQWFPKKDWREALPLVNDFRLDLRERKFPRRQLGLQDVLSETRDFVSSEASARLKALLNTASGELRLAAFQVRAARAILSRGDTNAGIVVAAGTGSGKTLAFYLPALLRIADLVSADARPSTKALAVYPRNELLKDQVSEAHGLTRRLDPLLSKVGRPLRIGTYYGGTPYRSTVEDLARAKWPKLGTGFVCPFLRCPKCGRQMIWTQAAIQQGHEALACEDRNCGTKTDPSQLSLTRASLRADKQGSPDILFTTTEMLHQRLSDSLEAEAFGIAGNVRGAVQFLLLDEIHTYDGATGAQTALVVRRWRHAFGKPVVVVGLSATLRPEDARAFFSDLTGLEEGSIDVVLPEEAELERQGAEYHLLLQGSPTGRPSTLSTSIQTAFLLPRMQNVRASDDPLGFFGRRVFAFSDNLDVANRLFDNTRGAEGWDVWGQRPVQAPLASLRAAANMPGDLRNKDAAGQLWWGPQELGWDLSQGLQVSRTTSQDAGVSRRTQLVVATSSLEVGYNDLEVGVILQHQAPRSMASYLQRRGRAGRTRTMRPLMVTVLSGFGRDRSMFERYEDLFEPSLTSIRLPVDNLHILKMQAVAALLDWLSRLSGMPRGWIWRRLAGPSTNSNEWDRRARQIILGALRSLVQGDIEARRRLRDHLRGALGIDDDLLNSLLYAPPRSLLMEVIPTLARRLAFDWQLHPNLVSSSTRTDVFAEQGVHPLPDFLPANLFTELMVPEVTLTVPAASKRHEERDLSVSITDAMTNFAPGRAQRRLAHERGKLTHWLPVTLQAGTHYTPLSELVERSEFIGEFSQEADGVDRAVPCYRPWAIRLALLPKLLREQSYGEYSWSTEILSPPEWLALPLGRSAQWTFLNPQTEFFLHSRRTPVSMRRFATEAGSTLYPVDGPPYEVVTRFQGTLDESVALGFETEVDGVRLQIELPSARELTTRAGRSPSLASWRVAWLRDMVIGDMALGAYASRWQRSQLLDLYLVAQGIESLAGGATAAVEVPTAAARVEAAADSEAESATTNSSSSELAELYGLAAVKQRLDQLRNLALTDSEDFGSWLRQRLEDTLGCTFAAAFALLVPKHAGPDSLVVDVGDRYPSTKPIRSIWITESDAGGSGAIEAAAERLSAEPRALHRAISAVLAPTASERVLDDLSRFVSLALGDQDVAAVVRDLVNAQDSDVERWEAARQNLAQVLHHRGLVVDRSLAVSLHHRLLRPGVGPGLHQLVQRLLELWLKTEKELGLALDLQHFCAAAAAINEVSQETAAVLPDTPGPRDDPPDVAAILAGVLWPRPHEIRKNALRSYAPYRRIGWTDPALVRELLPAAVPVAVQFSAAEWQEELRGLLAAHSLAHLEVSTSEQSKLKLYLLRVVAEPIDVGQLQFYPAIESVVTSGEKTVVVLTLPDLV